LRLWLLLLLVGCDELLPPTPRTIDAFESIAWRPAALETDPLAADRPERIRCDGWWPEEEGLFVWTEDCNWLTVHQPSRADIPGGALVETRLEHGDLTAPERAVGYVALWIDGVLVWDTEVRIPGPANEIPIAFEAPRDLPAGTPLTFHVHNHGGNVWVLAPPTVQVGM
jgi:hypothetical protein